MDFFCENCQNPVAFDAPNCPHCGVLFSGVKCPRCHYSGNITRFKKGCPKCGYIHVLSSGIKTSHKNEYKSTIPDKIFFPVLMLLLAMSIFLGLLYHRLL